MKITSFRRVAARAVVERVRLEFARLTIADGGPAHVSIGLVTFLRPPGTVGALTGAADGPTYQARNDGENRIEQVEQSGATAPPAVATL